MTKHEEEKIATAIREAVEQELEAGRIAKPDWLVQHVVGSWDPPRGNDADKWLTCGYANVRSIVRAVVRLWKPAADEDGDQQVALPGYEKLHRAYLISRESEQIIIRVDQLTVAEALDIIAELERTERGIRIHKAELLRYIDEVLLPREQTGVIDADSSKR